MGENHLEFLVEEPSMESFLRALLPRILPEDRTFEIHPFQGKNDLLSKLKDRLNGYAQWLPEGWTIAVVVDRDDDDCLVLKKQLESMAVTAGLRTRSQAGDTHYQVFNRLAIEELEAWYFGDWEAVRDAYPSVSKTVPSRRPYRDPDAISGGTWETFERILKRHGYFKTGLRKIEAARAIGALIDPQRCRSHSFKVFLHALREATT